MPHRVAMALNIVTMMTIAAAIPDVGGEGWTYFALSYALNRALTAYLYWRARCTDNAAMGGLSLFALAWTYFDCAGNAKPKSRTSAVLLRYWCSSPQLKRTPW
ncbi:hypothetical protein [Pseudidiomarina aestuarii]|uniref:hypothetical protein n=1 Tax=Pseudidiomarina aestuarii TaxID=624146 RepID=UPI003A97301A